jgi:hypothetical protein
MDVPICGSQNRDVRSIGRLDPQTHAEQTDRALAFRTERFDNALVCAYLGRVANPSARHRCLVPARLKPAWVPNLFCGSYRKGSCFDVAPELSSGFRSRLPLQIQGAQTRSCPGIKTIAAPDPILWMLHQPSLHRIEMHVIHLLVLFLGAPHIEIVEPSLPERLILPHGSFLPQPFLLRPRAPPPSVHRSRNALFQHLHHRAGIPHIRLADQKMDMFRHHDITNQREIVALSNFTENFEKEMPSPPRAQHRPTTITTASNKAQLAQSIAASQALLHRRKPEPFNPRRVRHPHGSRELSSELVVWYYPPGRHVNAKNNKKGSATRPFTLGTKD